MGGASSSWYDKNKRKILILCFEENYLKNVSKCLKQKEVMILDHIGFACENMEFNELDLRLWFLTCKNRHLWRHHYFGTQGVILIFSFNDKSKGESLIMENLNIFTDPIISQVPILVIFDTSNVMMESLNEIFRSKINSLTNKLVNTQYINFETELGYLKYGLQWLADYMKPISLD